MMTISCENLLPLTGFRAESAPELAGLTARNFLSFQDALHYLIGLCDLRGKTILIPAFYCAATVADMRKNGLTILFCPLDYKGFDIDVAGFERIVAEEKPDIVLIYNFFGKTSPLYTLRNWLGLLRPDALILSDFAHSLIPHHRIEFLTPRHVYIDSTRKTTSCMMAHLLTPPGFAQDDARITRASVFRYAIRALFFFKIACLRMATLTGWNIFAVWGMKFYVLHDRFIGSRPEAYAGFALDAWLYRHIDFNRIKTYRQALFMTYERVFPALAQAGFIELFSTPAAERGHLCFYFARVPAIEKIPALVAWCEEKGVWIDRLWDFDALEGITEEQRLWAKSIIVFPYTASTRPHHVEAIAGLMKDFFENDARSR